MLWRKIIMTGHPNDYHDARRCTRRISLGCAQYPCERWTCVCQFVLLFPFSLYLCLSTTQVKQYERMYTGCTTPYPVLFTSHVHHISVLRWHDEGQKTCEDGQKEEKWSLSKLTSLIILTDSGPRPRDRSAPSLATTPSGLDTANPPCVTTDVISSRQVVAVSRTTTHACMCEKLRPVTKGSFGSCDVRLGRQVSDVTPGVTPEKHKGGTLKTSLLQSLAPTCFYLPVSHHYWQ